MAIEKKEVFVVVCDRCGEYLDSYGYGGFSAYNTRDEAKEAIGESGGWVEKDGEYMCEGCWDEIEKCDQCSCTEGPFAYDDDGDLLCTDCLFENKCDEMGCGPNS